MATKILVADDEPSVLSSTSAVLRVLGFEVAGAARSCEILATLERERPDVLLQDVHMPGLDLAALMAAVRARPGFSALTVLLFTADLEAEGFWRVLGADGTIGKPFDPTELKQIIDAHVERRRAAPLDSGERRR